MVILMIVLKWWFSQDSWIVKIVITQKKALIFAENAPILTHDDSMLNQLAGSPIEIEATDVVPSNCGLTERIT